MESRNLRTHGIACNHDPVSGEGRPSLINPQTDTGGQPAQNLVAQASPGVLFVYYKRHSQKPSGQTNRHSHITTGSETDMRAISSQKP
jgi:hypothetical protein